MIRIVRLFIFTFIWISLGVLADGANGPGIPELGTLFYINNHLGSPNVMTNEAGEEVARLEYAPYGELLQNNLAGDPISTGTDNFREKFTGKEWDDEAGLYYFGARYYSPVTGRFTQTDPLVFGMSDSSHPVSLNRYAYAGNQPETNVDRDGRKGGVSFHIGLRLQNTIPPKTRTFSRGQMLAKLSSRKLTRKLPNTACAANAFDPYRRGGIIGSDYWKKQYAYKMKQLNRVKEVLANRRNWVTGKLVEENLTMEVEALLDGEDLQLPFDNIEQAKAFTGVDHATVRWFWAMRERIQYGTLPVGVTAKNLLQGLKEQAATCGISVVTPHLAIAQLEMEMKGASKTYLYVSSKLPELRAIVGHEYPVYQYLADAYSRIGCLE